MYCYVFAIILPALLSLSALLFVLFSSLCVLDRCSKVNRSNEAISSHKSWHLFDIDGEGDDFGTGK